MRSLTLPSLPSPRAPSARDGPIAPPGRRNGGDAARRNRASSVISRHDPLQSCARRPSRRRRPGRRWRACGGSRVRGSAAPGEPRPFLPEGCRERWTEPTGPRLPCGAQAPDAHGRADRPLGGHRRHPPARAGRPGRHRPHRLHRPSAGRERGRRQRDRAGRPAPRPVLQPHPPAGERPLRARRGHGRAAGHGGGATGREGTPRAGGRRLDTGFGPVGRPGGPDGRWGRARPAVRHHTRQNRAGHRDAAARGRPLPRLWHRGQLEIPAPPERRRPGVHAGAARRVPRSDEQRNGPGWRSPSSSGSSATGRPPRPHSPASR